MTKKDYETVARIFRVFDNQELAEDTGARLHELLRKALADQYAKDNPRFDRKRFLAACVKPTAVKKGGWL